MQVIVEIGQLDAEGGLSVPWTGDAELSIRVSNGEVVIAGNGDGLTSLAQQLLTLVALGQRGAFHLDADSGLEEGSSPVVLDLLT